MIIATTTKRVLAYPAYDACIFGDMQQGVSYTACRA